MTRTMLSLAILMLFGVVSGCNLLGDSDSYIYGDGDVDSIDIHVLESFPVQVQVIARGNLPDGCTELERIIQRRHLDAITFNIHIGTKRPKDASCTLALLDVLNLAAGEYTVVVNGMHETFELQVDNTP